MIAPVYYYQGVAQSALKSTAGATEAFKTFVAFKDSSDQTPLVVDARKRLARMTINGRERRRRRPCPDRE